MGDVRLCRAGAIPLTDLDAELVRLHWVNLVLLRWRSGSRTHPPVQETQETRVRSRGQEDFLEEGTAATYSPRGRGVGPDRGVSRHGIRPGKEGTQAVSVGGEEP